MHRSLALVRALIVPVAAIPLILLAADAFGNGSRTALLPFLLVCAVAGFLVILNTPPERVFLFWFCVAPFLQSSSRLSSVGHLLGQVLYEIPPLFLLLWAAISRRDRIRATLVDTFPAAFLVYALVSLLVTRQPPSPSVRGVLTTVGFGAVAYYFCAFGPLTRGLGERLTRVLLSTSIVLAAMALVEAATGWNLWHDTAWHQISPPRVVATLDNPAVLGMYLAVAFDVALVVLLWQGPARLRRLAIATAVVTPPAIFFTYTRGPILALLLATAPLVLLRSTIRARSVLAVLVGALALALAWSSLSTSQVYQRRVANGSTVETRVVLQNWSLKLAQKKPIFGWGYGSFDRIKNNSIELAATAKQEKLGQGSTSHDSFLTILVELGAVGMLLYLAPWLVIGRRLLKLVTRPGPERWWGLVCLVACAVYLVSAATFDMRFFSFAWALPWVALGLGRRLTATAHPA